VIGVDTGIDDVRVTTLATGRVILVESETSEAKPLTVEMRARHWETASLSITRQEQDSGTYPRNKVLSVEGVNNGILFDVCDSDIF
jgi:hypothetical protein